MPDTRAPDPEAHPQRLRVAHLSARQPTPFHLRPSAEVRAALAQELGIEGLPKLDFAGEVRADRGEAWRLDGRLTARVTQACVVTLKPVRTDLDEEVTLRFSPHASAPEGDEIEMPDETLEPLGTFIDLTAAMVEALALALPPYPRAEGAELAPAPETAEADEDDRRRPFADLDKLLRGGGTSD